VKSYYSWKFGTTRFSLPILPSLPIPLLAKISKRKIPIILEFTCNICSGKQKSYLHNLGREARSCIGCGSTVRMRSIIYGLSMALFKKPLCIGEFPVDLNIKGIGLSDWPGYANRLKEKFNYSNTYYHKEPKIDIMNVDPNKNGINDFLIASDVYEHVFSPVSMAFINSFRLLKPNGVFVFSVPYSMEGDTIEHFPDLHDFRIERSDGKQLLINRTLGGKTQIFENLVFHGGDGATLEMRHFTLPSIKHEFEKAGFKKIEILEESYLPFGIFWPDRKHLPMIVYKG